MRLLAGMTVALLVQGTPQSSQQPAAPVAATASLEGTVVRLGTSEPIAGADVELTRVEGTEAAPMTPQAIQYMSTVLQGGGPGGPLPPAAIAAEVKYAKTGQDGKFSFKELKAGKYRLVAVRVGGTFYPAEYGQHDPRQRGLHFPIREGETARDFKIEMIQTGSIAGRVLDEDGEPMGHILIMALEEQYREGERFLNMTQSVATDEHGNYRLYWLAPGSYYVAAVYEDQRRRTINPDPIPPGRRGPTDRATSPVLLRTHTPGGVLEETYAVVYNGSVVDPGGSRLIEVRSGLTTGGIDISMGAGRVRAHHIRGVAVNGTTGRPGAASLIAIPRKASPNMVVLTGSADNNGVFDLEGAMPGTSYSLFATTTTGNTAGIPAATLAAAAAAGVTLPGAGTTLLGLVPVEVSSRDVEGVKIVTTPGIGVTGRVVIEGRSRSDNDPDLARMRIGLRRDPDNIATPAGLTAPPAIAATPGVAAGPTPPPNGAVSGTGDFTLTMNTGDFKVTVSPLPAGAFIKSIRMGNIDVLNDGLHVYGQPDSALEITIGSGGSELTGVVTNNTMRITPNSVVVLIPDSPSLRRRPDLYRSGTTDHEGRFKLQNVLPGTYKLFAWEFAPPDAWLDPSFMQLYEAFGKPVSVREGEKQNVPANVIPQRRGL